MENKNTIIALVLMAVVWFGFSFLFPNKSVQPPIIQPAATEQTAPKPAVPVVTPEPSPVAVAPVVSQVNFAEAREIEVVTDVYKAVLTTSGARLKTLSLNKFKQNTDENSPQVYITDAQSMAETTLMTSGRDGWSIPQDAIYRVDSPESKLSITGSESKTLSFVWQDENGFQVEKIFIFSGDRYDCQLQVKLSNHGASTRQGSLTMGLIEPWSEDMKSSRLDFVGPMTLVKEDLKSDAVKDLAKETKVYQDPAWTAFSTKYFMSVLIPLSTTGNKVTISHQDHLVVNNLETSYASLAPGESAKFDFLAYLGPRDLDVVKQVGHRLDESIDFGFFSILALPLRHVLMFFYGFVGNFGVAIILLTVIIKMLFWPLTQKSYTSMKSMQKLQPEMQRLREKYKNDKERLNKEMMQMYKEKRVNPLGGCLPMVVQIPVFFALYKTLMVDIGLRQAPFAFWLTDLSAKDPYYITPVIMGITMFIQQKMSPTSMDPNQAKIFMLMPIVFTFMFLNFPAGLVIYWLVNNLLTIFQQYLIHRKPA
jgi:YidC/Oxa1 family membrane protein insertase